MALDNSTETFFASDAIASEFFGRCSGRLTPKQKESKMEELKYWLESNILESQIALVTLKHLEEVSGESENGTTVAEEESFKSALQFVLRHLEGSN